MILNYTTRQIICGLGFDLWRFAQTGPWAAAVLVDEFDAGTVRIPPLLFKTIWASSAADEGHWVRITKMEAPVAIRAPQRRKFRGNIQVALYMREFHFHFAKIQFLRVFKNNTIYNASGTRYLLPLSPHGKNFDG